MRKIIIIGGGASGMMAAISAARQNAKVILIEHMDRVGKKILSTGNGRCNYTNRKQGLRCYRGENPAFVLPILEQFGFEETISFFKGLGIFPKEREGYCYPATGQASCVLDALRLELRHLSVSILTGCRITSVKKRGNLFQIVTSQGAFEAECCIFACGGMAFPKSGSDGSAYSHIRKLGHAFIEQVPALVPMKSEPFLLKSAAGVRADASIMLYVDQEIACQDRGEIQLTKDGISGIPAFQASRCAAKALKERKKVHAVLDLIPFFTKEEFEQELFKRFLSKRQMTCGEACIGLFHKKLIPLLLKENKISPLDRLDQISKGKLLAFSDYPKKIEIPITGTENFEKAQATAGGVDTSELDCNTLESLLVPNLYFAGEVIDIDGICGGYNLQWAWSSGYTAGIHAAKAR